MIVRSTRTTICACLVALLVGAVPPRHRSRPAPCIGTVKDARAGSSLAPRSS